MATIGKTLFAHFRQVLHASAQYDQAITVFHRLKKRLEVSNLCSLSWDQTVNFSDLAHGLQRLQDSFAKRLGLTLPPLKNRFNYHTLVLFYKIRQNLAPKYLCSLVPDLSSTTSGFSFRKFSCPVPLTKKSATLESFLPRAIILWDDLPTNVQSSKTLSTFKTKLRVHLSL